MNEKLTAISLKIKNMVFRYPMILLMSLAMATTIIYGIETKPTKEVSFICMKLSIVFSLGISLMFALKMLSQRIGKSVLWHSLGILFLIGFYFILPTKEKNFTEVYAFLLVPTYILSHLLVAFVAFIKKENSEKSFWQFNKNLFINFFLTAVFTFVLTAGIEIAVVAIENLFNFDFDTVYAEIFVFFSIFGSTFIFLLFNENGLDHLEKEDNYPVVLKFFTQFILIPLLLIYVVILYFYTAKIVINWQLPRGWVSYLVLAYSLIGILALLLVHPLRNDSAKSWVKIFSKVFYYTLIPLIILQFTAIFTRVLQYGYTEARYFVLLIALWLSTVVLYYIFVKKATIKFIPISLFLFGLFALIFPYFNTFSVAKRSQKNELETILKENKLLINGKIDFNKPIIDTIANEIENKFDFLSDRFEKDYLEKFIDDEAFAKNANREYWQMNFFKNKIPTKKVQNNTYITLNAKNQPYDVKDFDYIFVLGNYFSEKEIPLNQDTITVKNYQGNFSLQINNQKEIKLNSKLEELFKEYKYNSDNNTYHVDNLFIETKFQKYLVKIVFNRISRSQYQNRQIEYDFENSVVLIKELH